MFTIPLDNPGLHSVATVVHPSDSGLTPLPRPDTLSPHSAVTSLVIILFTFIALCSRHLRHILSSIATEMLGVRRRNNAFDTHTAAESRTLAILILLAATCLAVILGAFITPAYAASPSLFASLLALTAGCYIFRLIACSVVGYTFTDSANSASWRRGLNLSQGLLGLLLLPPAVIILFYPALARPLIIISAIIWLAIRISFIYKGFRIFYNSYGSFVYFILYLCTLEVIPIIAVYSAARALSGQS